MDEALKLFPAWRDALEKHIANGLRPGDVICKHDIAKQCGLRPPVTAEDARRYDLQLMQIFNEYRAELLEVHLMDLQSLHSKGDYLVVEPKDQTANALQVGRAEIKAAVRKMAKRLHYVDLVALTDEQRREHADGLGRAAALGAFFRDPKLLGRPK